MPGLERQTDGGVGSVVLGDLRVQRADLLESPHLLVDHRRQPLARFGGACRKQTLQRQVSEPLSIWLAEFDHVPQRLHSGVELAGFFGLALVLLLELSLPGFLFRGHFGRFFQRIFQ